MMIRQGRAGYPVHEVVLHCSATPSFTWRKGHSIESVVDAFREWHKARGWRDVGYHRVIGYDGDIGIGRSLWEIGAHVAGHNAGTIGICLLGGGDSRATDRFSDHFTDAQRRAVEDYIHELNALTPIRKLSGHNEYSSKACPGFQVADEFDLAKILAG